MEETCTAVHVPSHTCDEAKREKKWRGDDGTQRDTADEWTTKGVKWQQAGEARRSGANGE